MGKWHNGTAWNGKWNGLVFGIINDSLKCSNVPYILENIYIIYIKVNAKE